MAKNISEPGNLNIDLIEFRRHALALIPDPFDPAPGVAYLVEEYSHDRKYMFCTCHDTETQSCSHIRILSKLFKKFRARLENGRLEDDFRSSIWYRLMNIMSEGSRETPESVRMRFSGNEGNRIIRALDSKGNHILTYYSTKADSSRFLERFSKTPDSTSVPHRGQVFDKLSLLTLAKDERLMLKQGFKTRRLSLEEGFWYRIAYHAYRELGTEGITFRPAIEESTGSFTITCHNKEKYPIFLMVIPRDRVRVLLKTFEELVPNQHQMPIHPIPLKSIFKINMNTELDLEVREQIELVQENGEAQYLDREYLNQYRYGHLVYIKELGILAELEDRDGKKRTFRAPVKMVLKKSQVPSFIEEFEEGLEKGDFIIDKEVKGLRILRQFDSVNINPHALDRDWCWLSMEYGFGKAKLSLSNIINAKINGQQYIGTPEGWVDCRSRAFQTLDFIVQDNNRQVIDKDAEPLKLSRMDLFRVCSSGCNSPEIKGDDAISNKLKSMLDFKPCSRIPVLKGMTSSLRKYQTRGVEWIWFLNENDFGGLLCDDMGLGKTHQAMAFMLGLIESRKIEKSVIVICPTTVMSHWTRKIQEHLPGIRTEMYHGPDRDIHETLKKNRIIITSYGVLRNDIETLRDIDFELAVFDEIQFIKNPETIAYHAADDLNAGMKLGLTGTPIENSIMELKALMDLTVPGYLEKDEEFKNRFLYPIQNDPDTPVREELSRLISPFTLRRLKKTVLKELPPKIEDIRTCTLTDDQVKLYRDVIQSRGNDLLEELKGSDKSVSYIHIFALLTLLKQICNHPASLNGDSRDYEKFESGKWELFKELLDECIESGQKVVVYSQFLSMLDIMESFLNKKSINHVKLTGASTNRGSIVDRFNNDRDCLVFLGSLRAGGTGIDLIGGSVVIHYDRWWNAAKEDQATDRVHRIGQRRGVQVFKLVTTGTLEEKISALIEVKRNLMDSIVKEDDPGILKAFTREQLIDLLSVPSL